MFGAFRTISVQLASGAFNRDFWEVDVPRAAQTYPAMWHAAIAVAAIYQSARQSKEAQAAQRLGYKARTVPAVRPNNYQYRLALTQFNKSIRHVVKVVGAGTSASKDTNSSSSNLTKAEQNIVIMTNILYVAITGMLEDTTLLQLHFGNLLKLLESLRFGDDDADVAAHDGMLGHDELFALVLGLDGTIKGDENLPWRDERSWVLKPRTYPAFASVTQAYIAFLPLCKPALTSHPRPPDTLQPVVTGNYLLVTRDFIRKLDALERSGVIVSEQDQQAVEFLHMYARVIEIWANPRTSRQDEIKADENLMPFLEQIDQRMSQQSPRSATYPQEPMPIVFSLTLCQILEFLATKPFNMHIRRRAIELMRKWPCKENGRSSDEQVFLYTCLIQHDLGGPARTRDHQLAGHPSVPRYENGSLTDREFDGTRECECVRELYVCNSHRLRDYRIYNNADPPYVHLACLYEAYYNLPGLKIPLS